MQLQGLPGTQPLGCHTVDTLGPPNSFKQPLFLVSDSLLSLVWSQFLFYLLPTGKMHWSSLVQGLPFRFLVLVDQCPQVPQCAQIPNSQVAEWCIAGHFCGWLFPLFPLASDCRCSHFESCHLCLAWPDGKRQVWLLLGHWHVWCWRGFSLCLHKCEFEKINPPLCHSTSSCTPAYSSLATTSPTSRCTKLTACLFLSSTLRCRTCSSNWKCEHRSTFQSWCQFSHQISFV